MPDYTANKRLIRPFYNEYSSDPFGWSSPINNDWDYIDAAFGGLTNLTQVTGTHLLAEADYRNLILQSASVLTENVRYNIPSGVGGQWIVRNATSGNFTLTIGTNVGGGTSVAVPQGQIEVVYSDGTNVRSTRSTADRFPVGGIVMWSGAIANIPTGWFLCDGSNSTPDLRNKFIIGAQEDDAGVPKTNITGSLTQTGGDKNAILVSHTHTATVTDPGHGHEFLYSNATQSSANQRPTGGFVLNEAPTLTTQSANTGAASTTNQIGEALTGVTVANSTEGVSGTNANLPPYYALAYIMRGPY